MQLDHTRTHTRTVTRTTQRGWPGPPSGPMAGPWRPKSEVPATKLRFATSNVVRWSSSHAKDPTAHPKARYLLVLVGPCSHASGVIPAHVPSTPATNTTHASILPAASCHQPARAELSQAASRREHAQSAEREPLAPRLAPTRPPRLTASYGYLCAMIGGPEGGGNDRLALILRLLELGHDEHLALDLLGDLASSGWRCSRPDDGRC